MNCEEAIKLMNGYLDGELDPITNQAIEKHLCECHNCDQAYKTQRSLISAIGNAAPYYKVPAGLRERVRSSLREEIEGEPLRSGVRGDHVMFHKGDAGSGYVLTELRCDRLGLAGPVVLRGIISRRGLRS